MLVEIQQDGGVLMDFITLLYNWDYSHFLSLLLCTVCYVYDFDRFI